MVALLLGRGVVLVSRQWAHCTEPAVLFIGRELYVATGALGFLVWILDQQVQRWQR